MTIRHIRWLTPVTCLLFMGILLCAGTFTNPNLNMMNARVFSGSPTTAAITGSSPFEKDNLLQDSSFETSDSWKYSLRSAANLTAIWDQAGQRGQFNHTSQMVNTSIRSIPISSATYPTMLDRKVLAALESEGGTTVPISYLLVPRILNVGFSESLANGDNISLVFSSGNDATISIHDESSYSDPVYGEGTYSGGSRQVVNITLSGLSAPRSTFNLVVQLSLSGSTYLDFVQGTTVGLPKELSMQKATISQTFSTLGYYNRSYALNFSGQIAAFQNIQSSNISVRINDTTIMEQSIPGTTGVNLISVPLPHNFLQTGGSFNLTFELSFRILTTLACNLLVYIDNVYLLETPNLNLLDNSECSTETNWTLGYTSNYGAVHYSPPGFFAFVSTQSGGTPQNGTTTLKQAFVKNSSQNEFQLALTYNPYNMTGVEYVDLLVYLNDSLASTLRINNSISSGWRLTNFNLSSIISSYTNCILNITLNVTVSSITPANVNWIFLLDNIYIYSVWDSTLTRVSLSSEEVPAGVTQELRYYYNTTITGEPIFDANITVYNSLTNIEWGRDIGNNPKYQVVNYNNGTYDVIISTVGYTQDTYILSANFSRPNFPDVADIFTLKITGRELNVEFIFGAEWNTEHQIWFVWDNNTPYVEDTSNKITALISDSSSSAPILNAFIEAELGVKVLDWTEIYKKTGDPSDQGYYDIFLDTTGMDFVAEYLQLNFTVRVTAINYSAQTETVTMKINPLPTTIAVPEVGSFYEGSTLDLLVIFQDTFHYTGIDDATLLWFVDENPLFFGNITFVFLGVYRDDLPLSELAPGNYTLKLTGEKKNYENGTLDLPIEVLPKWNTTLEITSPATIIEGNDYQIVYNFTFTEKSGSLVGESINFKIKYESTIIETTFGQFVDEDGLISLTIEVPDGATRVNITLDYAGEVDIHSFANTSLFNVTAKYGVLLSLDDTQFNAEYVGETNLEVTARLTFGDGVTPIVNATVIFLVGTSQTSVVTDSGGYAHAFVKLPTEGSFSIQCSYGGTSTIQSDSQQSLLEITVISPTDNTMRQITNYAIIAAIIMAIAILSYMTLDRGFVRPRKRKRQADYVHITNRFEDTRNIQLLMLINRESGTEIYSKALGGVPVDPTLVSGFLQAITSFGKELISEEKVEAQKPLKGPKALKGSKVLYAKMKGGKQEVQIMAFHHFKIVIQESAHVRVALLLLKDPSPRLLSALASFTARAETRFGSVVENLHGRQLTDEEVWDAIEDAFEPSLIYVHMIDVQAARTITPTHWEKVVLEEISKVPFSGEAYLDTLQEKIAQGHIGKELEIMTAGLSLRSKKALLPLSPRYMEIKITLKQAIEALPDAAKVVIEAIGEGEQDPAKLLSRAQVPQDQFAAIIQQLQELSIITDKYALDMPGKVVYTTLKFGK